MQDIQVAPDRVLGDSRALHYLGSIVEGLDEAESGTETITDEMGTALDASPNVIFFIKDTQGRYTHANLTLVRRLGFNRREDVIGRTESQLYPEATSSSYGKQDEKVLLGETIENELQAQVLPNHPGAWCLTHKRPLRVQGEIRGIIGSSLDIAPTDTTQPASNSLRRVYDYLHAHYTESVRVYVLAEMAGVSMTQLDRHFRAWYHLTPQQMLTKLRIDQAMQLLEGKDSMVAISHACGFADQSAFARQFKVTVGMTPRGYRAALVGRRKADTSR